MQNADMQWESTTQLDVGLDVGFLNDRVRFIFDYYNKKTDNMLFSITMPDTGPYSSVKANVGSARFYGFEAELNAEVIRTKNFSWNLGLTYSYNRNKGAVAARGVRLRRGGHVRQSLPAGRPTA